METIELIIKISMSVLNAVALGIVLVLISKWHRRMEDKIDDVKHYIRHVTDRNDVVYINQLEEMKLKLIKEERFEQADKISKAIEVEYKNLGIKKQ